MADADKIIAKLDSVEQPVLNAVSAALHGAGEIIQVAAQISISENSVSGKFHVPSRPGEPPNQDSGTLANGIVVTQPEPLRVDITSTAPYSLALEMGTSTMMPRPFMTPAVLGHKQEVINTIADAARAALRQKFKRI